MHEKSKIVLDTNVLISGTFWNTASSKILQLAEKRHITLLSSPEIMREYADVLQYPELMKKIKNHAECLIVAQRLMKLMLIVEPKKKHQIVREDSDDDKFIDAAIEGNASIIVSQDKHLLNIKKYQHITIMTPEAFLRT